MKGKRATPKAKSGRGRPKSINGDTIVAAYNITVKQANFIVDQALAAEVTESEIMRALIDYVMAQYKQAGRL